MQIALYLRRSEQWANKILFGIQLCTYNLWMNNKRQGFWDFWRAKRGLTGCDKEDRGRQGRVEIRFRVSEGPNAVVPALAKVARVGQPQFQFVCKRKGGPAPKDLVKLDMGS